MISSKAFREYLNLSGAKPDITNDVLSEILDRLEALERDSHAPQPIVTRDEFDAHVHEYNNGDEGGYMTSEARA